MNAMTKPQAKKDAVEVDAPSMEGTAAMPPVPAAKPKKKRKPLRLLLMIIVPLALVAGGGYYWITGGRYQETENAYLQQPKVQIASDAAGRVVEVDVADNLHVKKGDILFKVDPEPFRIALEQADAGLSAARTNVAQLRAAYSQAKAQERSAAGEVDYLKSQLDRQTDLSRKGITSRSALDDAQHNLQKAQEALSGARQAVVSALAALGGNPDIKTDEHPSVLSAQAARDKAAYDLAQATVRAPADGVISQASSFRVGQFVSTGTPLFTLVETNDSWVAANFKETQLTHMKPGQTAEVVFDTYPDHPVRATVAAVGAGTGAEFSLLPAQNATGNWVKVTQRIPVTLKLDPADTDIPMRVGMSASASVDTKVERGLNGVFAGWFGSKAEAAE